jgi:galactokinase/mevalonate kinase-like predicted kinase
MENELIKTILSENTALRNRSINLLVKDKDLDDLLNITKELEVFRTSCDNLYHKVRAALFLFFIHRFCLQENLQIPPHGEIPFDGVKAAYDRDFEKAIRIYLAEIEKRGSPDSSICSALADAYYKLSFTYLLNQVKRSISHTGENDHLFNTKGLDDYPFTTPPDLTVADSTTGVYPVLMETCPVRLDPSHSGWSDIFFLGMDFPEGARVVNISINLKVHGSDGEILPPCECYSRFIPEPVIHLVSIDLKSSKKISTLKELYNFGNDYLSLLKAGVVASGIVPPCFEDKTIELKDILRTLLNKSGGIEMVTRVNDIPKGSRLAVSTTLLATIITNLMRFSGQIKNLTGSLLEKERRTVASRAILGEWLGGSGGGWQDSGGLWPGSKVISGKKAGKGCPEFGVSRGCLLPEHNLLSRHEMSPEVEEKILNSLVLVHGGISQDVGTILEMVTEKYLLKYEKEWNARLEGIKLFDEIVRALKAGEMKELGRLTTRDWEEPLQQIIPWVNNAFTEDLISRVRQQFGDDYWGFLMLGGMSGGGMAFIVNPQVREKFKKSIVDIMGELNSVYDFSLPFIINPVVYDFAFNHEGIVSRVLTGGKAHIPHLHSGPGNNNNACLESNSLMNTAEIIETFGFDRRSHEHMQVMLKKGEIGLRENRLPATTPISNVGNNELSHFEIESADPHLYELGMAALKRNEIVTVSFAGGLGSRWASGSAVVKPVSPFLRIAGRYRTFLEIHLAKSRKTGELSGHSAPHIFTTSYLTHHAIEKYLKAFNYFDYEGPLYLSPAKTIGHRVYPMERDLRFFWEEQLQQKLDENVQKVQDDLRTALIEWSKSRGEGEDYTENKGILRFNPPGHWYEIPNLIKNGLMAKLLKGNPGLKYLFCHNIDTLGANLDPTLFGMHITSQACLSFEVTPRRIEDQGGGLAKIDGHRRLIEGLALPREEDEYRLTYYNSLTNWITIDSLLKFFGLDRELLLEAEYKLAYREKIIEAIQQIEKKIPTYVTIKDVKYIWGNGQEDVYPVAQFEKLWGDMTSLNELAVHYVAVSRLRGQQLKEPSRLDMWCMDGSLDYLTNIVSF